MPVEHRRQLELCPLVVGVKQSAPERGLTRRTDLAYQLQRLVAFGAAAVRDSGDPGWDVVRLGTTAQVECAHPPHLAEGGAYDVHRLSAIGYVAAHGGQGRWCASGVEVPERRMVTGTHLDGQFPQGLIGDMHIGPIFLAHLACQACHRGPEWLAFPLAQRPAEVNVAGAMPTLSSPTGTIWRSWAVWRRLVRAGTPQQNCSCCSTFSEVRPGGRPRRSGTTSWVRS